MERGKRLGVRNSGQQDQTRAGKETTTPMKKKTSRNKPKKAAKPAETGTTKEGATKEEPSAHITRSRELFSRLGVPEGFEIILCSQTHLGQKVYLMGSQRINGELKAHAYGPHTVTPPRQFPAKVWLENHRGVSFPVNEEELLVRCGEKKTLQKG
jgi:hypothetical protein